MVNNWSKLVTKMAVIGPSWLLAGQSCLFLFCFLL